MESYHVAWWNVENLFDTSSSTDRPEWLAKRLKSELKGWTAAVLKKKIGNLSKGLCHAAGTMRTSPSDLNVFTLPEMVSGRYSTPSRFGRPSSSGHDPNGFSDHLPLTLRITEH